MEQLENRVLLAANPWHNYSNPEDVDGDTHINPLDALLVINELNRGGARHLGDVAALNESSEGEDNPGVMVDVNGDDHLTPMDVLRVVNHLNAEGAGELARVELKPVVDQEVSVDFQSPNTPRPALPSVDGDQIPDVDVGTKFRVETRVQDIRTDDGDGDANPSNNLGIFASYLDFDLTYVSPASGFTIPAFSVPPGSSDLDPGVELQVGDLGYPVAYRNGDIFTNGDLRSYIYSNGPKGDVSTPGIVNDIGAFQLSTAPLGSNPQFVFDLQLTPVSIVAFDDTASLDENGTVEVDVLANDELISGVKTITAGGPSTHGGAAAGTEMLAFGNTGFGTGGQGTLTGSIVPENMIEFVNTSVNIPLNGRSLTIPTQTFSASKGTVTVKDLGGGVQVLEYKANAGETGSDSFTYILSDGAGVTKTGTVNVTINAVNDPPTLGDIPNPAAIQEDAPQQTVSLTGITAGINESQPLQVSATSNNTGLIPNPTVNYTSPGGTGSLNYTPVANQSGNATITVTVTDGGLDNILATAGDNASVSKEFAVSVTAVNDDPTLTVPGGTQTVDENSSSNSITGISFADIDVESDDLRVSLSVGQGNLSLGGTGGLDFSGGTGDGTNDPSMTFTGPLTSINTAVNGLTYTPNTDYSGGDTLSITVNDQGNNGTGGGGDIPDTVTLDVAPTARPKAVDDGHTVAEDDSNGETLDVLTNDRPTVNGTLSIVKIDGQTIAQGNSAQTSNGGTVRNDGTSLHYTPAPNFFGPDTFTYEVEDVNPHDPLADPTADVTVNVTASNDVPTLDAISNQTTSEDTAQSVNLEGISAGPLESQVLSVTAASSNTGLIPNPTVNYTSPGATGSLSYTPVLNQTGNATVTVTVTDAGLDGIPGNADDASTSQSFTVEVTPVNDAPAITAPTTATVAEDNSLAFTNGSTVSINDVEGNDVAVSLTATNGSIGVAANGVMFTDNDGSDGTLAFNGSVSAINAVLAGLTYDPTADFNTPADGTATLTIAVDDGLAGGTNSQIASITVTEVNDKPTAVDDTGFTTNEETTKTIAIADLTNNDLRGPTNESGQTLTITSVSTTNGSANIVGSNVVFDPLQDFVGDAIITYTVQDDGNTNGAADPLTDEGEFTVSVTGVNDAPVNTLPGNQTTDEDAPFTFSSTNVIPNGISITDADAGPNIVQVSGAVDKGTLTLSGGQPGSSFTLNNTVANINAALNGMTFTPPSGHNSNVDGLITLTITTNDQGNSEGTNNSLTGTPLSDTDSLTIEVVDRNDTPIPQNDNVTGAEGGTLSNINPLANDSAGPNEDGNQTLTIVGYDATTTRGGTVTSDGIGTFTYTPPDTDFNTVDEPPLDTFTYTVRDNGTTLGQPDPKEATGTVTVNVTEVNDAPTTTRDLLLTDPNPAPGTEVTFSPTVLTQNDSPGPSNESGQTLTVTSVSGSNYVALVNGQIVFTVPGDFGTTHLHEVTYEVTDNGETGGASDPKTAIGTVQIRDVVLSTYSGYVYIDSNGNGQKDTWERGIGGVTIEVSGTGIDGQPISAQPVTTDPNGYYEFVDVMPGDGGTLTISETQLDFYRDGAETVGHQGGQVVANDKIGVSSNLLGHATGTQGTGNNFGEAFGGVPAGTSPEDAPAVAADNIRAVENLGAGFLLQSYLQNDPSLRSGLMFSVDPTTGDVPWFINLEAWDGYTLVGQTAPGVFNVVDTAAGDVVRTIDTSQVANSLMQKGEVYRIFGTPQDFGLPSHSGSGEGEATDVARSAQPVEDQAPPSVDDQTVETVAAAGDASDYASAVDYLLSGIVG